MIMNHFDEPLTAFSSNRTRIPPARPRLELYRATSGSQVTQVGGGQQRVHRA